MIVIGVDTHKRSHTLVALDAVSGGVRGQLTIAASDDGTIDAVRFAGELASERVWAVEDCRRVSGRLERGLLASGDRVWAGCRADARRNATQVSVAAAAPEGVPYGNPLLGVLPESPSATPGDVLTIAVLHSHQPNLVAAINVCARRAPSPPKRRWR